MLHYALKIDLFDVKRIISPGFLYETAFFCRKFVSGHFFRIQMRKADQERHLLPVKVLLRRLALQFQGGARTGSRRRSNKPGD